MNTKYIQCSSLDRTDLKHKPEKKKRSLTFSVYFDHVLCVYAFMLCAFVISQCDIVLQHSIVLLATCYASKTMAIRN